MQDHGLGALTYLVKGHSDLFTDIPTNVGLWLAGTQALIGICVPTWTFQTYSRQILYMLARSACVWFLVLTAIFVSCGRPSRQGLSAARVSWW